MSSAWEPPTLRQQLRVLWQFRHHESLFQMFQRLPPQRATRSLHQNHSRKLSLRLSVVHLLTVAGWNRIVLSLSPKSSGGRSPDGDRNRLANSRRGGRTAESVFGVQETGRVDGVQVQVRDHVLWGPQVPGEARVHVRFQDDWKRGDSESKSAGQSWEVGEDLIRSVYLEKVYRNTTHEQFYDDETMVCHVEDDVDV